MASNSKVRVIDVEELPTPTLWFNIAKRTTKDVSLFNAVDEEITVDVEHNLSDVADLNKIHADFNESFRNE